MTKAEEVLDALATEFVCDCGARYPLPEARSYRHCHCDRSWGFVTDDKLEDGRSVWWVEKARPEFKFVNRETGWAMWH